MNTDAIDHLVKGLQHFAVFHKLTNINALDNYGYRELMQIVELKQIIPSIEKVPGRSGADAVAPEQGYTNIELKSTGVKKLPSIDRWPSAMFDMSKITSQQKVYEFEGFGHGLFAPAQPIPICSYWIGKEHYKKLHPLFDKKIEEKKIADDVVTAIKTAAGTGKIGDGKVFVLSLEEAMRIRTAETGAEAL